MDPPITVLKSVAERSPIIINDIVQVALVNGRDEKTPQATISLRVRIERRVEEYLVQVINEKNLRFHYSDHITDAKFKELSENWQLSNMAMDEFFENELPDLLLKKSASIQCLVSSDGQKCTLQLTIPLEKFLVQRAIELTLLTGEDLASHLIATVYKQHTKLHKSCAQLKAFEECKKENRRLTQDKEDLERKVDELTSELAASSSKCNSLARDIHDIQNDCEIFKDKAEQLQDKAEQLQIEVDELEDDLRGEIADYDALKQEHDGAMAEKQEEIDRYREIVTRMDRQIKKLEADNDQANHILRKYLGPGVVSVSDTKLRELEEAGREKDLLIEQLTKQNSEIQQKAEKAAESVTAAQEKLEHSNKALMAAICEKKALIQRMAKLENAANTPKKLLPPQVGMPPTSCFPQQQMNPYSPQMGPQFDYRMVPNNSPLLARPGPMHPSSYPTTVSTPMLSKYLNPRISPLSSRTTPTLPAVPPSIVMGHSTPSLTPLLDRALREKENAVPPSNRLH